MFYIDLILFGNKCDLASKRQVATDTAKDYAESIGAEHLEMSALSSHGKASVSGANIRLKLTKPWHYIALLGCSFSHMIKTGMLGMGSLNCFSEINIYNIFFISCL